MRQDNGWSALLTRPIPMRDGRFLRTLQDARNLTIASRRAREQTVPLIEGAAKSGSPDDIERVTGQLEMVLFGEAAIDLRQRR